MADNKGTYQIVNSCPSVQPYAATGGRGFNMDSVKMMLTSLQPDHVAEVGQAYLAAADALAAATEKLHQRAQRLTEVWSGKDAELALGRLRQLNVTASGLQEASTKTGRTYSWLGHEILPWYRDEGEKMGHGYVRDGGDDQDALEMLDRMDNRILQGYTNMPPSIEKDLPPPERDSGFQGTRGHQGTTDAGTVGPPSGVPHGPPPVGISDPSGHHPTTAPIGPADPIPSDPWGPGGPDGDPSGVSTTGGTDLAGAGGGMGADPFGAGGLGGGPGGLGGGAGGLGSGAPGGVGGALGVGTPGGMGAGRGGSAGKGTAGRSGARKSGPSTPMGGGAGHGGGEGEEERERTTWLTEDEDVWSDDGDVAPPVIE